MKTLNVSDRQRQIQNATRQLRHIARNVAPELADWTAEDWWNERASSEIIVTEKLFVTTIGRAVRQAFDFVPSDIDSLNEWAEDVPALTDFWAIVRDDQFWPSTKAGSP